MTGVWTRNKNLKELTVSCLVLMLGSILILNFYLNYRFARMNEESHMAAARLLDLVKNPVSRSGGTGMDRAAESEGRCPERAGTAGSVRHFPGSGTVCRPCRAAAESETVGYAAAVFSLRRNGSVSFLLSEREAETDRLSGGVYTRRAEGRLQPGD